MSIEVASKYGWFISHENYIKEVYKNVDNSNESYQLKPELFKIMSPFKQNKYVKDSANIDANQEEFDQEVCRVKGLFNKLCEELNHIQSNKLEIDQENKEALHIANFVYTESGKYIIGDAQGGNASEYPTAKMLQNATFIFPQNSLFFCRDVANISSYISQKYDLILLDPPWRNKYIRRKRKSSDHGYKMMFDQDLQELPLDNLLEDNGLIVVWCTNSLQHLKALQSSIFAKWGVKFIAKWYWVKVTQSFVTVCPFSKPPRKQPFEQIIFACKENRELENPPADKLIVSIPSAVHSHKPPLTKLLEPFLPTNPKCLEIFARYLLPNWTSYGKEALRLQHESLYNKVMAGRLLALRAVKATKVPLGCAPMSQDIRAIIGNREIVGYGFNGQPNYADRPEFPMPAIRWKEPTPDIMALREKEKGDWRKLSIEEKKALYRASFCQTFAEFKAPTGEWKSVIGIGLIFVSAAIWLYYGMKVFVYAPLPDSFKEENRRAQLRRIIDLQVNPIQGIASKWDYEKDDWKK